MRGIYFLTILSGTLQLGADIETAGFNFKQAVDSTLNKKQCTLIGKYLTNVTKIFWFIHHTPIFVSFLVSDSHVGNLKIYFE